MNIFPNEFEAGERNPQTQDSNFGPWVQSERINNTLTASSPRKQKNQAKFLATIRPKRSVNNLSNLKLQLQKRNEAEQCFELKDCIDKRSFANFFTQNSKKHRQQNIALRNNQIQETTRWEPLAATIYLYEKEQKRRTYKNVSVSFYDNMTQIKTTNGTKNLQRILKMKQRIRIKNCSDVRKIKQKINTIDTSVYSSQKSSVDTHDKKWKSTTLVGSNDSDTIHRPSYRSKVLTIKRSLKS